MAGSGGVCGWEWGECVDGSGVTGSGECEKMKGFQMHLFAHCAHTPVFFFIMCSKVVYSLLFLFVLVVYAHTYVFVPFVLCYRNFHMCVQLANFMLSLCLFYHRIHTHLPEDS